MSTGVRFVVVIIPMMISVVTASIGVMPGIGGSVAIAGI
jgi:hypothetical protein